jgi:PST family polysaccharide transporter
MLAYGKNVLFSSIIDYILSNSSYILIGSMIGPTSLGLYSFAYDKSMIVINNITSPIIAISFPAFSRLQNHKEKLKAAFFKSVKMISLVAFLFGFCQLVLAPEFISTFFGSKWLPAIILFQIIIIYSMVRSLVLTGSPILEAIGKPNIVLKWNLIYAPIYIGSIYLGFKAGGILGIASMTTLTGIMGSLTFLTIIMRVLNWHISELFSTIKPALFCSAFTGFVLFIAKYFLKHLEISNIFVLLILGLTGLLIYAVSIKLFFKDTYDFILANMEKLVGSRVYNLFTLKVKRVKN